MEKKHVIWQNYNFDVKDWDLSEVYEDWEEMDESEKYEKIIDLNNEYYGDEKFNLDQKLDNVLIAYGTVGLWNGTFKFVRRLGDNLNCCLAWVDKDSDYYEFFVDTDNEMKVKCSHHDGTNYYTVRKLKKGVEWNNVNKDNVEELSEPIGQEIAKVYGWE